MGGLPKLTIEQRNEIIKRGQSGEFCSMLAREYNLTSDYVSKLVNRGIPMRMKIDSTMGRGAKRVYATASSWPRTNTTPKHPNNGSVTAHQKKSDIQEVRIYLRQNPEATVFDVAMECNLGEKHARRIMKEVRQV